MTSDRALRLAAATNAANALTSLGFSVAALVAKGPDGGGAARTNAGYALSRSLPLAAAAVVQLARPSRPATLLLSGVLASMQAGDAVVGRAIKDPMKTYGPLGLAAVTGAAAMGTRRR